jgi:hypothetical protein
MPWNRKYQYPAARGETVETPIPDSHAARLHSSAARLWASRRGFAVRCRWRGGVLRVTRVV